MPFKYKEIEKRLTKMGYKAIRQKGSHVIFSNGKNTFPVPNHGSRDISTGVENKLIKILGITSDEFRNIK